MSRSKKGTEKKEQKYVTRITRSLQFGSAYRFHLNPSLAAHPPSSDMAAIISNIDSVVAPCANSCFFSQTTLLVELFTPHPLS